VPTTARVLADLVVLVHATFVLFVVGGGLLALRWPRVMWLHAPAVVWGTVVELCDRRCPLTPLEIWLRSQAGEAGYHGDFVAHYVLPILYPAHLTRTLQLLLGAGAITVNLLVYTWLLRRRSP
jgi:hypothetical protein